MNKLKTMDEYIADHCKASMEKAISAERFPLWKRSCDSIDDVTFSARPRWPLDEKAPFLKGAGVDHS